MTSPLTLLVLVLVVFAAGVVAFLVEEFLWEGDDESWRSGPAAADAAPADVSSSTSAEP